MKKCSARLYKHSEVLSMKNERQLKILEIIDTNDISTQDELSLVLKKEGLDATQATLSRDIKELQLVKTMSKNGVYKYTRHKSESYSVISDKFKTIFSDATIAIDFAGNITVIKCHTGMANAACTAIDHMKIDDVVGTIAGDDTIFILLRSPEKAAELADKLNKLVRGR